MGERIEEIARKLDSEFDSLLASMKPHVLKLPHKTERQKCALWIKKLCDNSFSGISGRRNRNDYAQLMLHMLKTSGRLDGPFALSPEKGYLPSLPRKTLSVPQQPTLETQAGKIDSRRSKETSYETNGRTVQNGADVISSQDSSDNFHSQKIDDITTDTTSKTTSKKLESSRWWESRAITGEAASETDTGPDDSRLRAPLLSSSLENRENALHRNLEKGVEMKVKVVEAKFQEEKLKLQQRHDDDVQNILQRKNQEIDEMRLQYRTKIREHEDRARATEKKLSTLARESATLRETKEQQLNELRKLVEETNQTQTNDYERKIHEIVAAFEQEKFELQKQNTKNMEDLLTETNERLTTMEADYAKEADATACIVKDLENRIATLTEDAEISASSRQRLIQEMAMLEARGDEAQSKLRDAEENAAEAQRSIETAKKDFETNLQHTSATHKAAAELLRQELTSTNDKLRRSEDDVDSLKRDRERLETEAREHKTSLDQLAVKIANVEAEARQMEKSSAIQDSESQSKIVRLEEAFRSKRKECERLKSELESQSVSSENALREFQQKMEGSAAKTYKEMQQQMQAVEADLDTSRVLREKQSKEMKRQMDEEKKMAQKEIERLQNEMETQRLTLTKDAMLEKDLLQKAKDDEIDQLKNLHFGELERVIEEYTSKKEIDDAAVSELEQQLKELRNQLMESNSESRRQITEANEKSETISREAKLKAEELERKHKSQMEQQRLFLSRSHAEEMESTLGNAGSKLKRIEEEYRRRIEDEIEKNKRLSEQLSTTRNEMDDKDEEHRLRLEEEQDRHKTDLEFERRNGATEVLKQQQEVEILKGKLRNFERRLEHQELDFDDQMTKIRLEHEERLSTMLPDDLRQQLEDTIASLKLQVQSLNQRAVLLQEELDGL